MASDTVTENGIVGRMGTSRAFLAIAVLVSFSAFIVSSEISRGYRADVDVLVIPGGQAIPAAEIVANVVFLSETTGFRSVFFDEVGSIPGLMALEDMDDLTGAAKRDLFESMISVSRASGSIFSVRSIAEDPDDAKAIARSAALSLFRYASRYYDVEEEADFRIVDGPIVSARSPNVVLSLLGSIAFGFAFSGLMFFSRSAITGILTTASRPKMPLPGNPFAADIFKPKRPVSPLLEPETPEAVAAISEQRPTIEGNDRKEMIPDAVTGPDSFFEPAPAPGVTAGPAAPSAASSDVPASGMKKAPAPLDVPIYSEEEERFLKEFSFEEFTEGDDTRVGSVVSEPVSETEAEEPPVAAAPVNLPIGEPDVVDHPAPSKSDYQRRLNELLRG